MESDRCRTIPPNLTVTDMGRSVLRLCNLATEFADLMAHSARSHGGVQVWRLLKIAKALDRVRVAPLGKLIDQSHLDQRRLLRLQSVGDAVSDLRLARVAAEGVERREAHVHAPVVAQRMQQGAIGPADRVALRAAPADALQALAGGLLLEHRDHHQLAHVGELSMHGGNFVGVCGNGFLVDVRADVIRQRSEEQRSRRRRREANGATRRNSMALRARWNR